MLGKFGASKFFSFRFLVSVKFNNYYYPKKLTKNRHFCVMDGKEIVPEHLVAKMETSVAYEPASHFLGLGQPGPSKPA